MSPSMFSLLSWSLALLAITFTETSRGFPYVEYCFVSPRHGDNESNSSFTIQGELPKNVGDSIACQIQRDKNASFLSINASKESSGSLRVAILNSEMARTIGNLEVSGDDNSSFQLVCLDKTPSELDNENKYVVISGTPKMNFTVQIEFITNELLLGEKPQIFEGRKIFMFLPKRQSKDAQLDITVESDSNAPGILTVSQFCGKTEKFDHVIDHSKPMIFLTFAKKGRVTLSRVSNPSFEPSNKKQRPLFISVLPPNKKDFGKFNKSGHISLKTSFNYDYSKPICLIVFLSFFGGILVAYWALKCFKEPLALLISSGPSLESTSGNEPSIKVKRGMFLGCCRDSDVDKGELQPLVLPRQSYTPITFKEILRAMFTVLRHHWVGKGRKTFSYTTCIVGFVLLVGAFQFVYVNWSVMVEDGNRDKCYYNDWCYRVSAFSDIPFNLMISNLSYMIHGVILAWAIWVMEAEIYVKARRKAAIEHKNPLKTTDESVQLPSHALICSNLHVHLPELSVPHFICNDDKRILDIYTRAYKKKYSLSIGYAFAWALIFEGLFSLTYHLCPSRLTFQFDSAFMFVIAGLIVVSLFNGLSVKECQKERGNPRPIEDTTFFLFIIVPLYILNYLGSVYDKSDGGKTFPLYIYFIFCLAMIFWYVSTFFWSLNKLFHSSFKNGFNTFESKVKMGLFVTTVLTNCVILPSFLYKDISHLLLFSSIATALASSIGKVTIKAYKATKAGYQSFSTIVLRIFQASYIICTIAVMSAAVYVFQGIPTSNKTDLPDVSRNLNKDCVLVRFYDDHDVWHIMSSFGLLMGAFLVMYISE